MDLCLLWNQFGINSARSDCKYDVSAGLQLRRHTPEQWPNWPRLLATSLSWGMCVISKACTQMCNTMPLTVCICLVLIFVSVAVFDLNQVYILQGFCMRVYAFFMLTLPLCPGNTRNQKKKKNRNTGKGIHFHPQITINSNLQNNSLFNSSTCRTFWQAFFLKSTVTEYAS